MFQQQEVAIDRLISLTLMVIITYWSYQLLYPLLGVLLWSLILTVALYPTFVWLSKRLGDRPKLSAVILTFFNLLIVVGTLVILTDNMVENLLRLTTDVRAGKQMIPTPPTSIEEWPLVGKPLYRLWSSAAENLTAVMQEYSHDMVKTASIILGKMANKGLEFILFIISVIFSGYLLTQGNNLYIYAGKFAERVAPNRGALLIKLMNETVKNVSRGIIGIALIQAIGFGILLLISGIPGAGLLSFIALLLCIVQAGLFLLVLPVAIWLFFSKSFVFALIVTLLLVAVTLLDSFLKPIVLSRGLETPMLIIFIGVIGGVVVYGLVGIFIGPVVLAVFYDLLHHWLEASPIRG